MAIVKVEQIFIFQRLCCYGNSCKTLFAPTCCAKAAVLPGTRALQQSPAAAAGVGQPSAPSQSSTETGCQ